MVVIRDRGYMVFSGKELNCMTRRTCFLAITKNQRVQVM